jgi:hypothetical protein
MGLAAQRHEIGFTREKSRRRIEIMDTHRIRKWSLLMGTAFRLAVSATLTLVVLAPLGRGGEAGVEELERPDGRRVEGGIVGDVRAGFRFVPRGASTAIPLERGSMVHFNGSGPDSLASLPPFHVLVGESLRLSGSLVELSDSVVRLRVGARMGGAVLPRRCVQAIVQRPGEARVLVDSFETLDKSRWTITGKAEVVDSPRLSDRRSLRLPAAGSSVTHSLDEPLEAGRLDLAFLDDGMVVPGCRCEIEAVFRGSAGRSVIRVILGWSEQSLAVVSSPSGQALPVQRLARKPGWHRFSLRFGPDQTEIALDGQELAHGKGPEGPLTAVGMATVTEGAPAQSPAAHFDDFQLIRFAEPPVSLELDVTQDEARLVVGDQLYGAIQRADSDQVVMRVDGKPVSLRWSEVAGLYFRRVPAQGVPIQGLLVRVEWRTAPGEDLSDLDFAEGALAGLDASALTLATPYAGVLVIPRDQLRRLMVTGQGQRLVIDPTAHHLGDEISVTAPRLDPPQPEGLSLERTVDLAQVPEAPVWIVLDVVEVVGETSNSEFSRLIREGDLRTYVAVNGKRIDYLNRHIKTQNETPERVRIPIPGGLLRPGKNTLRIEVTGTSDSPKLFDDLGILQIALEVPATPGPLPPRSQPGPP